MIACSAIRPMNRLLATLPDEDYQRLAPDLELVFLSRRQVLHEADEPINYVYFPNDAVVSLLTVMQDGSSVEIGLVGEEGLVGTAAALGSGVSAAQAMVQLAGTGLRIRVAAFKAAFARGGTLQLLVLRYVQVLFLQISQSAACNRLHRLEARLARWLLTFHDRVQTDEFPITHEFIAQMLGTRRAGVTVAAQFLQQAGMIHYGRGSMKILDRCKMEATACECYQRIGAEFSGLLSIHESL